MPTPGLLILSHPDFAAKLTHNLKMKNIPTASIKQWGELKGRRNDVSTLLLVLSHPSPVQRNKELALFTPHSRPQSQSQTEHI